LQQGIIRIPTEMKPGHVFPNTRQEFVTSYHQNFQDKCKQSMYVDPSVF